MTTELETLLVRLVGDASAYLKTLDEVQHKTEQTSTSVSDSVNKIGTSLAVAGAAMTAAFGAAAYQAFDAWSEAEKIGLQLTATLEANQRDVAALSAEYQEFATQLQATTTAEDDATLALLKQAESFQLTGTAAKKATADSLALAAVNDSSAQAMIRITAAMAQGDIERAMMFSRMIPQLRGVKDQLEFTDRYNKLVASGQKVLSRELETGAGAWKRLKNDIGNANEEIGKVISGAIVPLANSLREAVLWFQSLPQPVKELTATVLALGTGLGIVTTAVGGTILAYNNLIAATGAARVGTIGLHAAFVALGAVAIYQLISALREYRGELEGVEGAQKQLERLSKDKSVFNVETQKIAGGGVSDIQAAVEREEKALKNYQVTLDEAKRLRGEYDKWWGTPLHKLMGLRPQENGEYVQSLDKVNEQITELEMRAGLSKERIEQLTGAIKGFGTTKTSPAILQTIKDLEAETMKAIDTFGKSDLEKKIHDLMNPPKGVRATDSQVAPLRANQMALDRLEQEKKAAEDFAKQWHKLIEDQKEDDKRLAQGFAQQWKKMVDERTAAMNQLVSGGKSIVEQALASDPVRKFGMDMEKLEAALAAGKITADEFNLAQDYLQKQMDKNADKTKKAREEIQKFDAALAGSAEAITRLQQFQDLVNLRRGPGDGAALNRNPALQQPIPVQPVQPPGQPQPGQPPAGRQTEVQLLGDIRDLLKKLALKEGIVLQPANLGGGP